MFSRLLLRWEISPSSGSHFQALDGLRGVAILLVVSFHTLYTNPAWGLPARLFNWGVIQPGWMGVPIFFVLSGFLISYPFFQKRAVNPQFWYPRGYAWRRLGKILPPFYLSILLFLGFYWWQYHDPAYLKSAGMWATGLGNFISISPNFNGVYWSLIVESHFYIVLPLFFFFTRGLSVERTGLVIFCSLFFTALIARQLVWPAGLQILPDPKTDVFIQTTLKLTRFPCQLDYFAWGVLFAAIFVSLSPIGISNLKSLSLLGYLGVALMAVTLTSWGLWQEAFNIREHMPRWSIEISHLLPALATMLMLFFIFDRESLGGRILCMGWLRFVGVVSFEWFLFHLPIVGWFQEHGVLHANGNLWLYAWKTIVPLTLTFIFSALVYRYFSLPILHRVRDHLRKD